MDPENRLKEIGEPREIEVILKATSNVLSQCAIIQGWTAFHFPGRGTKVIHVVNVGDSYRPLYSTAASSGHTNISLVSCSLTFGETDLDGLAGLDWDHRTRSKGIYRIVSDNHKGWSKRVDTENGNYDYLLGIDVMIPLFS